MKKVVIAFDVDGTLRCNCTEICQDVNRRIVDLVYIMSKMKNTRIMIWSGGGADYARAFFFRFQEASGLKRIHYAGKLDSSTWKWGKPDIAIDDIQSCELGTVNLIVNEK